MSGNEWHDVCQEAELEPGGMRRAAVGRGVVVCRLGDELFALDDNCTHQDYPLSDGYLDDDVLECPLHMAQYCVRTGQALALPATEPLRMHETSLVDGVVRVRLAAAEGSS